MHSSLLRKADKKDADPLYEHILKFEQSSQFMDWKTCVKPEDSRKWLEGFLKESEKDNRMQYVVDEKGEDTRQDITRSGLKKSLGISNKIF